MRQKYKWVGAAIATLLIAPAGFAKEAPPRPELFRKLVECRAIADNALRLACFDAQVTQLAEAEARNDVVVVDRVQVQKARKSLFGLTLPDLGLFGGDDPKDEGVDQIETKITSAALSRDGKWRFTVEDGAKWVQTERRSIHAPAPGDSVRIRKAAMGSFFANIDGRTAIRVRREN